MNVRDAKIDIIKSLGIILVVLGHTQMALCAFVNLFHVGLFFLASGYCYQEKYSDSVSNLKMFFGKRVKGLYVPFVLWNIGYLCFRNLFSVIGLYDNSVIGIGEFLRQIIEILALRSGEQLAGACWFVRALFILEILFAVSDTILKQIFNEKQSHIGRWIIAVGMLVIGAILNERGIIPLYNIATVCSAWILYVLGLELKRLKISDKLYVEKTPNIIWGTVLCGMILVILSRFGTISYDSNRYPNAVFFVVAAVAGWGMAWNFAVLVERFVPRIAKGMTYIGKRTMYVLFLHLLCFKIVSCIYVFLHGMDKSVLAAFPVISVEWWWVYWLVGVVGTLGIGVCIEAIKLRIGKCRPSRRYPAVITLALLFVTVPNMIACGVNKEPVLEVSEEELDYSLVYDEDYYLECNLDIAEVIGKNSEELLEHFIVNGMDEGRLASEKFDVYYYKDANSDLETAYGDNLKEYYLHYMRYGYEEGRKGCNAVTITYDSQLYAEIVNENTIKFTIEVINDTLIGEALYIYELAAYRDKIGGGEYLAEGVFLESQVIEIEDIKVAENLNSKYVVAVKTDKGVEIVSNYAFVSNPEVLCKTKVERPVAYSKKGLQISNTMLDDVEELNVSYPFMNLVIQHIMAPNDKNEPVITYNYKGREYYFLESRISEYDELLLRLTKNGSVITASIISVKSDGFEELYYPGISMDTGATYYAVNTTTKEGVEYLEAFVSFMSERYDGTEGRGLISNWTVGNEVNESGTYNYMGEKEMYDYLKEYTRTFRIIYNTIKSNNDTANVYMPMEPWWGIGSNMLTYGGREFLSTFNEIMAKEGDIDWGVAYHAYSFPLSDPKVLNDTERTIDTNGELTLEGYVTTDNEKSVTITMENIEVLVEFMQQEEFLDKNGEVRSIILSEQGYTSNSNLYGKCEAQQAASMLYAYYKSEMIEEIDAFIYFLQLDNTAASLGNNYYLFGLWEENEDGMISEKLSHEVYRFMDTKESLDKLSYIKNILGIENWEQVISDFNSDVFVEFEHAKDTEEEKLDIGSVSVDEIAVQKYTGSECLPEIHVKYKGKYLTNDEDYDVVFLNNVEIGEAKAVIVGLNDFEGIKEVTFTISE